MTDYSHYQRILVDVTDRLATVTLNRPEQRNAIDHVMHRELARIWVDLAEDPEVFAILLTGAGPAFSVGGNVRGMLDRPGGDVVAEGEVFEPGSARRIVYNLLDLDKPVVCAMRGHAIGLGATIALLSDVTVASTTAKIADTHVKVGLVAGDGGAALWPLLVGPSRAKELLMRGLLLDGAEAERIGLVNHAVPAEEVLDMARAGLPGDPLDDRGVRHPGRGGPRPGVPLRRGARRRPHAPRAHAAVLDGEAVRHRHGRARDLRRPAGPRRPRLHARAPRGAVRQGRPPDVDLRRHQRDPEEHHRAERAASAR